MYNSNDKRSHRAKIRVFGIGGGGTNAVGTMIRSNIEGVEFIAANTDIQSLDCSPAQTKIQLGKDLTKGLGAGTNPDIGRDAALEDRQEIQESLHGADMVFITAGMGGGTGTGGAAIAAQIAKEQGALTVGVVTKPFIFEGSKRQRHAERGIERLKEFVDTLIVIPNQRLLQIASDNLTLKDAFKKVDEVLVNAVRGISDIINTPGTVNVDFADVKAIMSGTGHALMGIGWASGERRAYEAASQAISSPLLEDIDIEGATGILINITGSDNLSLLEVNEICSIVQKSAHEDANIIFGAVLDESMHNEVRVTVIATGFPYEGAQVEKSVPRSVLQSFHDEPTRFTYPKATPTTAPRQRVAPMPLAPTPQAAQPPVFSETEQLARLTMQPIAPLAIETMPILPLPLLDQNQFALPTDGYAEEVLESISPRKTFTQAHEADLTPPPLMHAMDEDSKEIDAKIKEALQITEQLSVRKTDDLDVPAFIRKGIETPLA